MGQDQPATAESREDARRPRDDFYRVTLVEVDASFLDQDAHAVQLSDHEAAGVPGHATPWHSRHLIEGHEGVAIQVVLEERIAVVGGHDEEGVVPLAELDESVAYGH